MYKIIFIFIGIFILMYLYTKYNVNTLEVTKYVVENKKVPNSAIALSGTVQHGNFDFSTKTRLLLTWLYHGK